LFAGKTHYNFIEKDKKNPTLTKSMKSEVLCLTGALGGWKSRCTWYQFVAHIIVFVQCSITVRESAELGESPQPPAPAKLSFKQKYSTHFRKTKWTKLHIFLGLFFDADARIQSTTKYIGKCYSEVERKSLEDNISFYLTICFLKYI